MGSSCGVGVGGCFSCCRLFKHSCRVISGFNIPIFKGAKFTVAAGVGVDSDFKGCISGLRLGGLINAQDSRGKAKGGMAKLAKFVVDSANIGECGINGRDEDAGACSEQPCRNGGLCKPLSEKGQFKCYCPWGFAGRTCKKGQLHAHTHYGDKTALYSARFNFSDQDG